jgi:hypothetical protein
VTPTTRTGYSRESTSRWRAANRHIEEANRIARYALGFEEPHPMITMRIMV